MKIFRNIKPLRVLIYEEIVRNIKKGIFKKGDKLPNEIELSKMLKVSRASLREALLLLEEDGYLINKRGIGRTIAENNKKTFTLLAPNVEPIKVLTSKGLDLKSRVIYEQKPSLFIANKLKSKRKVRVMVIEQDILFKDKVVGYILNFVPLSIISEINSRVYDQPVYELISRKVNLSSINVEFKATAAGKSYGSKLGTKPSTPVLLVEETFYSEIKKPVLYLRNYLLTEKINLRVNIPINIIENGVI